MEENRNLTRELKLLDLIIENFVPQEEVQLLNDRLQYDEDQDEWFVKEDSLQQGKKSLFIYYNRFKKLIVIINKF